MKNLIFAKSIITGSEPISGHLAHIRHLTSPKALQSILYEGHSYNKVESKKLAMDITPFIQQALMFYDLSCKAQLRIKPVLQYYCYLNFTMSLILIYRPKGWEEYAKHGAEDKTKNIKNLKLDTGVVKLRKGAIPLFHKIFCDMPLPSYTLTFKDILSSIPMVFAELKTFFGIETNKINVSMLVDKDKTHSFSRLIFSLQENCSVNFPTRRFNKLLPLLIGNYKLIKKNSNTRKYIKYVTFY